jgi:hypothetical protein
MVSKHRTGRTQVYVVSQPKLRTRRNQWKWSLHIEAHVRVNIKRDRSRETHNFASSLQGKRAKLLVTYQSLHGTLAITSIEHSTSTWKHINQIQLSLQVTIPLSHQFTRPPFKDTVRPCAPSSQLLVDLFQKTSEPLFHLFDSGRFAVRVGAL